MFDQAQLKTGQTVVVHGAAGNVGAYAVQPAHREGVQTVETAAMGDIPFVRDLGAHAVIDYRTQRFEEVVRDADASLIWLVAKHKRTRFRSCVEAGG